MSEQRAHEDALRRGFEAKLAAIDSTTKQPAIPEAELGICAPALLLCYACGLTVLFIVRVSFQIIRNERA